MVCEPVLGAFPTQVCLSFLRLCCIESSSANGFHHPIRKVYKFRMDPTGLEALELERAASVARFVYNWALGQWDTRRRKTLVDCESAPATPWGWLYEPRTP
jgi:hypothetical protein